MEPWETITMSRKEARRPGVLELAVAGKITTAEGARSLTMSLRQFRRLNARYRAAGVRGLSSAANATASVANPSPPDGRTFSLHS